MVTGAALLVAALALALYGATLAPGLTWAHDGADGGDLLAAALVGGVPHPPGYPVYQLLLRAGIALSPLEPAATGNWLSALAGAAAAGLLAALAARSLGATATAVAAGMGAAATWAVSPLLWGQAVITEVYALYALAGVTVLALCYLVLEAPTPRRQALLGLALGLGAGVHLSLFLLAPAVVVLVVRLGPGVRRLGVVAAACAAGLAVYLYLPLAAAGRPAVNWGDPVTPDRFLWLVTARAYGSLPFGLPAADLPARLAAWAAQPVRQFGVAGVLLALAGCYAMQARRRELWLLTVYTFVAFSVYAVAYNSRDSYVYLLPATAAGALWIAEGVQATARAIEDRVRWPAVLPLLPALLLALLLPLRLGGYYPADANLSGDRTARAWVDRVLAAAPRDAVLLAASDRATFALAYAVDGLGERPDLTVVNTHLYAYDWYRESLAGRAPSLSPSGSAAAMPAAVEGLAVSSRRPVLLVEPMGIWRPDGAAAAAA